MFIENLRYIYVIVIWKEDKWWKWSKIPKSEEKEEAKEF